MAAAAFGQPPFPQSTTILFRVAAPHARFLVRLQGVLEAFVENLAIGADSSRHCDLLDSRTGAAYREKQAGIGVEA